VDTVNKPNLWQIRKAVKPFLDKTNEVILFGCSGGADSLALALALFAEREGKTIIPVVVDHGLQSESKKITEDVISKLKSIGFNQVVLGITEALVRSADLLRDDADALDGFAVEFFNQADPINLSVKDLERLPKAIRTRVLRLAIYKAGAPQGMLTADHISSAEALISDWHGQKELSLPGNVKLLRNSGRIILSTGI